MGCISATGIPWFREYFEPLLPGCVFAPATRCCECELGLKYPECQLGCLLAMERLIQWERFPLHVLIRPVRRPEGGALSR